MNVGLAPVAAGSSKLRSTSAVLALLAGAIAPVLVAIALLVSAARRRPLLVRYLVPEEGRTAGLVARITVIWGIGLIVIGGLQFAFSAIANLSLLSPLSFLIRTLGALALETGLLVGTVSYVRRRR